jgi:hypothetical protein
MRKHIGKSVLASAAFLTIGLGTAGTAGAELVTYTIDPAESALTLTGQLTDNTASQQSSGSLFTSYSGSIVADRGATTIQFPGGSALNAAVSGNYFPDNDGFDDTDPGDYGRTAPGPFGTTAFEAIRDLVFDLFDDTSGLGATVAANGSFPSTSFGLEIDDGESDTMFGLGGNPDNSLIGKGTANSSGLGSSSVVVNGDIETLTLKISTGPIGYNVSQSGDSTLVFTGTIVATRTIIPEPGSVALAAVSAAGMLLGRRRRRRGA